MVAEGEVVAANTVAIAAASDGNSGSWHWNYGRKDLSSCEVPGVHAKSERTNGLLSGINIIVA